MAEPTPEKIVARIRAQGANVVVDGDKLRIVNRERLAPEGVAFIRQHGKAIAAFLAQEDERVEEEAMHIARDGSPREWARAFADVLIRKRPAGVSEMDWSWFITRCGQIIDEAPAHEGASW